MSTSPTSPTADAGARSSSRVASPLERLRIDRHLDEALVSGADPLHLAEVFGICETTAIRYAAAARQLLSTPTEQTDDPVAHAGRHAQPTIN
ncbi:hypothetical protein FXF52_38290 [Micromonospora sp. MP36]|nr:hypothetical protein FXF52_38290 [Micromonospora sp. MP36]